ncbi:MAG: FG-GAP repeat protein [Ignavibacteriae bacterium]|nr:FG-GAP repeat protein [Ignavibacteriota bacterium]
MKNYIQLFCLSAILLLLTGSAEANWIKSENDMTFTHSTPDTQQTQNTQHSNSDSLPAGVTKEWLNSLTDENGQKLMHNEDPEGDAMQERFFTGYAAGDQFGYSVASAGDVNGDGYDDIIIGAPFNDAGGTDAGRAYVYFGGSSMNNVSDVTMTGAAANGYFGTSVSFAGDINGDGYSDVIVGAPYSNSLKVFIYFGGNSMNNVADLKLRGTNSGLGISVSTAGDVNGDGFGDVIVGSTIDIVHIYFGGNSADTIPDVTFNGVLFDHFGYSVSSAGDVNGDGFSDIIIGASSSGTGGRAYIYFGGSSMNNVADVIMTGGEGGSDDFGISVSSAGDVNGDGYSDVLVGANNYGGAFEGRAYVYYGGSSMNNVADLKITGGNFNWLGFSVSSAGDMNGDGYSDIIIGAPISGTGGRANLYLNSMTGADIEDEFFAGAAANDQFGTSVSSAGDMNGDGFNDIIIGAPLNDAGGNNAGRAYIYFGGSIMDNVADRIMTGTAAGDQFGTSVSSAGDVNGDGFSDVIIGAYLNDAGGSDAGRAYIYFGGNSPDTIADVIMTGATAVDQFRYSVSSAGDVNGDGFSDVIVGALGNDAGGLDAGRTYIYYGGSVMNNVADRIMTGAAAGDQFGYSVSLADDVNGDGFSDVITGANGNDAGGSNAGRAYVYFGGILSDTIADLILTGAAAGDNFGYSVSSAGDVNGDSYTDIIIGAQLNDAGGADAGRAYIYFGGISPDNIADVTINGEAAGDQFGYSVSSAGDVNGDGFSDVIIGAILNDAGGSNAGRAYVYFGGSAMNNVSDVIMTGAAANDRFGFSVSSAGDMNGDGLSDVIVGGPLNDQGGTNIGRTYLYLSSAPSVKPIFSTVKDVPNDQGGKVFLKWARSGYDVSGINMITDYLVYRSYPPSGGGFSWELRSVIPATSRPLYTYTDNTPSDSSSGGNGTMYYQIMARTSIPSQYWLSGILSGRSIDNIAPLMVSPFSAAPSGNNVRLTWNRSSAPDLLNYILFRSVNPTIDPFTDTPLGTATDSTYLDTAPLNGSYYYFIIAQDIHGNYSPVAVTQRPSTTLNLTTYIEGFYNSGTNLLVSDTITVQLRNSTSPFAVVDQAKGILASNGTLQLTFGNASSGNYYIRITHRNSIETWSSSGIAFTSGGSVSYDFTPAKTQAFGNNMKQVDATPLKFGIFVGDQNQDGAVNLNDVVNVYNNSISFVNGYVTSDMDGNNITDLSDLVLTSNNAGLFAAVVRP